MNNIMEIVKLPTKNTDEAIVLSIVWAYIIGWILNIPIPTEPLMIILGYYFGKKAKL